MLQLCPLFLILIMVSPCDTFAVSETWIPVGAGIFDNPWCFENVYNSCTANYIYSVSSMPPI